MELTKGRFHKFHRNDLSLKNPNTDLDITGAPGSFEPVSGSVRSLCQVMGIIQYVR